MTCTSANLFPPWDWKYNFFTFKDVEMSFQLEMRRFYPIILFDKSIKKSAFNHIKINKSNGNDYV